MTGVSPKASRARATASRAAPSACASRRAASSSAADRRCLAPLERSTLLRTRPIDHPAGLPKRGADRAVLPPYLVTSRIGHRRVDAAECPGASPCSPPHTSRCAPTPRSAGLTPAAGTAAIVRAREKLAHLAHAPGPHHLRTTRNRASISANVSHEVHGAIVGATGWLQHAVEPIVDAQPRGQPPVGGNGVHVHHGESEARERVRAARRAAASSSVPRKSSIQFRWTKNARGGRSEALYSASATASATACLVRAGGHVGLGEERKPHRPARVVAQRTDRHAPHAGGRAHVQVEALRNAQRHLGTAVVRDEVRQVRGHG